MCNQLLIQKKKAWIKDAILWWKNCERHAIRETTMDYVTETQNYMYNVFEQKNYIQKWLSIRVIFPFLYALCRIVALSQLNKYVWRAFQLLKFDFPPLNKSRFCLRSNEIQCSTTQKLNQSTFFKNPTE